MTLEIKLGGLGGRCVSYRKK